jgi:hypothetical protein
MPLIRVSARSSGSSPGISVPRSLTIWSRGIVSAMYQVLYFKVVTVMLMRILKLPKILIDKILETQTLIRDRVSRKYLGKSFYLTDGDRVYGLVQIEKFFPKKKSDGTVFYVVKFKILEKYPEPIKKVYFKYSKGINPYKLLEEAIRKNILDEKEKELAQKILQSKSFSVDKSSETELFLGRFLRRIYRKLYIL